MKTSLFEIKTVYHTSTTMNNIFIETVEATSETMAKRKMAELVKEANEGKVDIVRNEILEIA